MRLEAVGLRSGYGSATVIRGIDLAVAEGEAVGLVGRNGMGKTTLLRTLLGYLRPESGSVRLDDVDVTGWLPEKVARCGVAYVPQEQVVFADLSVEDNLLAASLGRRPDRRRREQVLEFFPVLGRRLRQRAGTLSGGEQKMLGLSRALLADQRLLVVDEVSDGLQPAVVDTVERALCWERETRGTTLLMVEQNLRLSLALCDRVGVVKLGELRAEERADAEGAHDRLAALLAP